MRAHVAKILRCGILVSPSPRRGGSEGEDHVLPRDVTAHLGSGYATVFARRDCAEHCGVEVLSQGEMFTAEPKGRVIRRDSMQHPERHLVAK
jgi:hypothetical protein